MRRIADAWESAAIEADREADLGRVEGWPDGWGDPTVPVVYWRRQARIARDRAVAIRATANRLIMTANTDRSTP